MYELFISRHALKDIADLPKNVVPRVTKAIDALRSDPRPPGCKKLKGSLSNSGGSAWVTIA